MLNDLFKSRLVGPFRFERYVIRDNRKLGIERFWTGKGWTSKIDAAMRFADPKRMTATIFRLTKKHCSRKYRKRQYRFMIDISVYGPDYVTQQEIEAYIKEALVSRLDYRRCGTGPNDNTMVIASIPANNLSEVKEE